MKRFTFGFLVTVLALNSLPTYSQGVGVMPGYAVQLEESQLFRDKQNAAKILAQQKVLGLDEDEARAIVEQPTPAVVHKFTEKELADALEKALDELKLDATVVAETPIELFLAPEATPTNPHLIYRMDGTKRLGWGYRPHPVDLSKMTKGAHHYKVAVSGTDRRELIILDDDFIGGALKIDNIDKNIRVTMKEQSKEVAFLFVNTKNGDKFEKVEKAGFDFEAPYGEYEVRVMNGDGNETLWSGKYIHADPKPTKVADTPTFTDLKIAPEATKTKPYYVDDGKRKGWFYGPVAVDLEAFGQGIHHIKATPSGFDRREVIVINDDYFAGGLKVDNVDGVVRLTSSQDITINIKASDQNGYVVFPAGDTDQPINFSANEPITFPANYGPLAFEIIPESEGNPLKFTYQHNPITKQTVTY